MVDSLSGFGLWGSAGIATGLAIAVNVLLRPITHALLGIGRPLARPHG